VSKDEIYLDVTRQLASVLEGCPNPVSAMASACALLKDRLDYAFWVGFYLPEPDGSLVVGPYQGPLACLVLPPGRGVCGEVARTHVTAIVPDVEQQPGHIACDARSRSEIVVPVLHADRLVAVLDLDSDRAGAFDETDRRHLENIAVLVSSRGDNV